MASPYVIHLSATQFFGTLAAFVVLVVAIFGGIPMIPRSAERRKNAMFSMRALLVLYTRAGSPFIASGGNFFRVTMYDDFLLITFLLDQKIAYEDIDAVDLKSKYLPEVRLSVGKTRIRIFGCRPKMETLYNALKKHTR